VRLGWSSVRAAGRTLLQLNREFLMMGIVVPKHVEPIRSTIT